MNSKKNKIIVIGAGLSGLTTAFRLERELPNAEVTVLEAHAYAGGRMLSTSFGGEAGGEAIGFYHKGIQDLAKDVDVALAICPTNYYHKSFDIAYYLKRQNEWVKQSDWEEWERNPLPKEMRKVTPILLIRHYVAKIPKPKTLDDVFTNPYFAELASKSFEQFLKEVGVTPEALQLIKSSGEVNDVAHVSAFNILAKIWFSESTLDENYYFVPGGQQNFPKAIAKNLKDVKYQKKVIAVNRVGNQYEVITENEEKFECDFVVFAIPAGPMCKIEMNPPLTGLQKEAFETIEYSPSIKTFFRAKSPFWLVDHLPLCMWTDTDVNIVMPVYDAKTRETPLNGPDLWGIYAFTNCQQAVRLYKKQEETNIPIQVMVQDILEEIRPALKGNLEYVESVDWFKRETSMGAFHYYPPSPKVPSFYEAIRKPSLNRHFAGEHTNLKTRGFNAAVDSGLRVAKEICEACLAKNTD